MDQNNLTAVEWLLKNLKDKLSIEQANAIISQAKAIEKNQIINAYVECWKSNMPDGYECKQSAEEYYNETYKNNEQ
jgi:HEPN domain-containing protein